MIDLERVRQETPGVEQVIHFNNAGSSLPPAVVVDTVTEYLRHEARMGGYEAAAESEAEIQDVYRLAARLVGARKSSEIAITENATRGWDMVFYGLKFTPGDRVIVGSADYGSNAIAYMHHAVGQGAEIRVVQSDQFGQIDLIELEQELRHPRARMVSLVHVPTQSGLINPAERVGELAHRYGVLYFLDACQSVGQFAVDVQDISCDVLSTTGRKYLRGPRGTGFLYVKEAAQDRLQPAFLENGSAIWDTPWSYAVKEGAHRYESWEKSYALALGLGAAIRYALDIGLESIEARNKLLANEFRKDLGNIPEVEVVDPEGPKSAIVSFTVGGDSGNERVKSALNRLGINVSISRPTSSQWDLPARGLTSVIRASVHYYNTRLEVQTVVEAVRKTVMSNADNLASATGSESIRGQV